MIRLCWQNALNILVLGKMDNAKLLISIEHHNDLGYCRLVTHGMELLTADNDYADTLLHEERPNLGGMSIEELHRLVYAQVLCSHSLTWQVSYVTLSSFLFIRHIKIQSLQFLTNNLAIIFYCSIVNLKWLDL